MSKKKNKLVYGWGVNDVDYDVHRYEVIDGEKKCVWFCPYYQKWHSILQRCLCLKYQERQPTYKGCTVSEEWKHLSDFIKWVDFQPNKDWQECESDKDFLAQGNKHYSPETVVFVSRMVNQFIKDRGNARGSYMVGVCYKPSLSKKKPYLTRCSNPFGGSRHVGLFPTELEAHLAWQSQKHEYACQMANLQSDERIAKVLRERYAPDKDWTKV